MGREPNGIFRNFGSDCVQHLIASNAQNLKGLLERETGFEPATSSLGSWHSTTELLPPFGKSSS